MPTGVTVTVPEEIVSEYTRDNSGVSIKHILGTKEAEVELEVDGRVKIVKVDFSTEFDAATTEQKNVLKGMERQIIALAVNQVNSDATPIDGTDITDDSYGS